MIIATNILTEIRLAYKVCSMFCRRIPLQNALRKRDQFQLEYEVSMEDLDKRRKEKEEVRVTAKYFHCLAFCCGFMTIRFAAACPFVQSMAGFQYPSKKLRSCPFQSNYTTCLLHLEAPQPS